MNLFKKRPYIQLNKAEQQVDYSEDIPAFPDGKWIQCPDCKRAIYHEDLTVFKICKHCQYHFRMNAYDRLNLLLEEYEELFCHLTRKHSISFPDYDEKIETIKRQTQLDEAVVVVKGRIADQCVIVAVMDPHFMMGSMGQIVGEKITRAFEYATREKLPIIVCTASGGARMQEGIFSLMQMAKISGAVAQHASEGLLYLTVLTDPTTGGVTASFAMQGDIILAEKGAIVGFAGKRVIEQTIKQQLPDEFQKAETVLEQGFIDHVVHRTELKKVLKQLLSWHA